MNILSNPDKKLIALGVLLGSLCWLFGSKAQAEKGMGLKVEGDRLLVESRTFTAEFAGARLKSLKAKDGGLELLRHEEAAFPLELVYANNDRLREDKGQRLLVKLLSERAARIVVQGNDSDRELFVRLDPATGDLCVSPSGRSARRGVLAVRWNLPFAKEAALVLPCINGLLVESGREFPGNDRFTWPFRWNVQLAIAQREGRSLMVHSQDTDCQFNCLRPEASLVSAGARLADSQRGAQRAGRLVLAAPDP